MGVCHSDPHCNFCLSCQEGSLVEKLYYKKALDTSFLLKGIQDKKYRKMRHQVWDSEWEREKDRAKDRDRQGADIHIESIREQERFTQC